MPFYILSRNKTTSEFQITLELKNDVHKTDQSNFSLTGTKTTLKTICMIEKEDIVSDVLFVKATPILEDKNFILILKSVALNLKMRIPVDQDCETWTEVIKGNKLETNKFDIVLSEEETPALAFAPLYHDTDLTDFELKTAEVVDGETTGCVSVHKTTGSVSIHKTVLAACSPVFRRMFSGQWKETSQGHVELPVDHAALIAFKQYIYTHKLTENLDQLKQLHLLSSYYMMPELKECSMDALVKKATETTAYDILQFAFDNHSRALALAVLERFNKNIVKVKDM